MSEAETIVGDYSLLNCVATGNTTQIWEAKHSGTGQIVALKLLLPESLSDAEAKKVLRAEATMGKKFEHPNLVKVYDLAVTKTYGYFSMEYLRAGALKSLIRNDKPGAHGIAKDLFLAVASGLEHMHEKGFLHRDIKPDNIIANKVGDFRMIDYSLAGPPDSKVSSMLKGARSRKIMGTRTYIAPEMIRRKPISFATDMYSLGITFYELLTGHPPFVGTDPNQVLIRHVRDRPADPKDDTPNLTDDANAIVMKMLEKDPKARFQTMQEFIQALRGVELWLEPPASYFAEIKAKEISGQDDGVKTLDSRADAAKVDRKISTTTPPPKPKPVAKPEPPKQPVASAPPQQAPPQPTPPQPVPPQMPPGYAPPYGQPGYPPAGYPPQPGYPQPQGYPGQPYPGQAYPGQMPPGQYPPGPAVPGQPYPGAAMPSQPPQGMPPQPAAPQQVPPPASAPPTQAPPPQAPTPPPAVAPQPVVPEPEQQKPGDDLEWMNELPPVS